MSETGWDILLVAALLGLIIYIAHTIKESTEVKIEPDADDYIDPDKPTPNK